jgi:hypothetical protein
MQAYGEELQSYGIGTIWLSLDKISQIPIYKVEYFSHNQINHNGEPQVRAIANTDEIAFAPQNVITRVEGILPTFGEVVVVDAKHKLARKEQILDRVHICDLHLQSYSLNGKPISDRGCILRFHDNHYRFEVGLQLLVKRSLEHIPPTVQEHWTELSKWLDRTILNVKIASDFQSFAEMSMSYPEFLQAIEETHIKLDRLKPSLWDNCFQLYSSTIFNYPNLAS